MITHNGLASDMGHGDPVIRCRPAESRDDYVEAFRLLYRRYYEAGLSRSNPTRMRIAPHQLSVECETIVVEQGDRIFGTISLVGDGPNKLPLDRHFPKAIDGLRQKGLTLIEVGCLASEEEATLHPSAAYAALTRATIQYANLGRYDRMIAAVHPRHCKLYEKAMGFQRLSETVPCDLVEGNLAVCVVGTPNAPEVYRQPWRNLFFSNPYSGFIQRKRPMSLEDRRYFERILEIGTNQDRDRDSHRRAA